MTRKLYTIDFETAWDAKTYSLSKMSTESYIRDPRFQVIGVGVAEGANEAVWYPGQEAGRYLKSLALHHHNVLAHNMAFDGAILAWAYGITPAYYFDTLSMARPITGLTVGGSLSALAKKFALGEKGDDTRWSSGKWFKDFTPEELAKYGKYCCNDVRLTYILFQVLKQWSTPQEMYIIDMLIRMYTDPVLELDKRVLQDHLAKVRSGKVHLMSQIDSQVDRAMLRSDPQFAKLLEAFGIDPPTKINKKGEVKYAFAKTDEEFKALGESPIAAVQCLVAARLGIKTTIEESRTEAFINIAERGTLPIMINYYGAHTGRGSGGDKINPQNMPRGGALRKSVLAPHRHVIVAGDSSQIEARTLAWFAGEFELVGDFRRGVDTYCKFASDVYEKEVIHTPAFTDERFLGKTCILGLGYMTGSKKLRRTLAVGKRPLKIDEAEADRIVRLYRSQFTMIVNLWDLADEALDSMVHGYECDFGVNLKLHCDSEGIALPNGMKLRYPNLRKGRYGLTYDTRRGPTTLYGGKMVENVIQALARIIVFNQMAKMDQWLRPLDAAAHAITWEHINAGGIPDNVMPRYKLAHTVHDEIVVVVPEHVEGETVETMTKIMSVAPSWAAGLPIACEVKSGVSYGACK